MKLYIRNMVSLRCTLYVEQELKNLGIHNAIVKTGEVTVKGSVAGDKLEKLRERMAVAGLELVDDKRAQLLEKIITLVVESIHEPDTMPRQSFTKLLGKKLGYDYNYLSAVFSEVKGITLEQFIILNKIDRVKELIIYHDLNLSEIAYKLNYSSCAHLSNQFKKITGLTPTYFRQLKKKRIEFA